MVIWTLITVASLLHLAVWIDYTLRDDVSKIEFAYAALVYTNGVVWFCTLLYRGVLL